MSLYIPDQP